MYLKYVQEQDCKSRNQGHMEMMHSLFNTRSAVPVRGEESLARWVCLTRVVESGGEPWDSLACFEVAANACLGA